MAEGNLILKLFNSKLSIVNVGLENMIEHFFHSNYDVEVIQVDWKPPGGGKPEILKKLRELSS